MASPKNSSRSLLFLEALLWVRAKSKSALLLKSDFSFLKLEDTSRLLNTFISLKVWELSERTPVQPNKFTSSDKVFL